MGLRVWLPLNGNLNNQGLSDIGAMTINSLSQYTNGKIGKAYQGWSVNHATNDFLGNQ